MRREAQAQHGEGGEVDLGIDVGVGVMLFDLELALVVKQTVQYKGSITVGTFNRQAVEGDAIVTGQKPTLSRCGIGLSQRAKAFAIKFPFDVKAILPVGVDVRVACRRQMHHISVIDVVAFGSQLI
jgi:hypothetical protein